MKPKYLFAVAPVVLAGAFFIFYRQLPGDTNRPTPTAMPVVSSIPSPTASPITSSNTASLQLSAVWIPGNDDKLHALSLSNAVKTAQAQKKSVTPALNEIVRLAPQFFPKGAQILAVKVENNKVSINLNAAFDDDDFWSQNGDKTTELAMYALANSVADLADARELPAPDGKPVTFSIQSKAIESFGEFDLSEPLPANPALQSNAPFKMPSQKPTSKPSGSAS